MAARLGKCLARSSALQQAILFASQKFGHAPATGPLDKQSHGWESFRVSLEAHTTTLLHALTCLMSEFRQ